MDDECVYHKDRKAKHTLLIEGAATIRVCTECRDRIMNRKIICRYCHVPVRGRNDTRAIPERTHARKCPRRLTS